MFGESKECLNYLCKKQKKKEEEKGKEKKKKNRKKKVEEEKNWAPTCNMGQYNFGCGPLFLGFPLLQEKHKFCRFLKIRCLSLEGSCCLCLSVY